MRAQAQSLRDRADYVHGFRRDERQNRTGGEDVDQCDEGRSDEDRAREGTNRITRFASKDGNVFKTAERAEHHLSENAEAEDGQWGHYQAERMVFRDRPAPAVEQRGGNEREENNESGNASDVAQPLADVQAQSREQHHAGDEDERN